MTKVLATAPAEIKAVHYVDFRSSDCLEIKEDLDVEMPHWKDLLPFAVELTWNREENPSFNIKRAFRSVVCFDNAGLPAGLKTEFVMERLEGQYGPQFHIAEKILNSYEEVAALLKNRLSSEDIEKIKNSFNENSFFKRGAKVFRMSKNSDDVAISHSGEILWEKDRPVLQP